MSPSKDLNAVGKPDTTRIRNFASTRSVRNLFDTNTKKRRRQKRKNVGEFIDKPSKPKSC